MKVHIVVWVSQEDTEILGVYSTLNKAKEFIDGRSLPNYILSLEVE